MVRTDGVPNGATGKRIVVDAYSNSYVAARNQKFVGGGDILCVKYDRGGEELWRRVWDVPGASDETPVDLLLGLDGHLYVLGVITADSTRFDYLVVKFNGETGAPIWGARYDGPDHWEDLPVAIATDSQGYIYVTGWSRQRGIRTSTQDFLTIKYDPQDGSEVWVRRYGGPEDKDTNELAVGIAVDGDDNVVVTGHTAPKLGKKDVVTVRYNAAGDFLGDMVYGAPADDNDTASKLVIDLQGNIFVAAGASENSRKPPTSKATFSIGSRYSAPGTEPTGRMELFLHESGIRFTSDALNWMVISGRSAMIEAVGRVDGVPGYHLLAKLTDSESKNEADRIYVHLYHAESNTSLYESPGGTAESMPGQEVQAGEITIH